MFIFLYKTSAGLILVILYQQATFAKIEANLNI